MNTVLSEVIKKANTKDLVEVYFSIEPMVLSFIDKQKKQMALEDIKKGRIKNANSASDIMKKCLQT